MHPESGLFLRQWGTRPVALPTIAELLSSKEIAAQAPVLHASAKTFANTLIRNRATIGGNLVNNAPCADTAPALLVLDAEVELSSEGGKRWLRLADFLQAPFSVDKEDQEMLTAVRFGVPPANRIGRFRKMGLRKISCMAKVDVAMLLTFDDAHKCSDARLSLGAACPTALRAAEAETALTGKELSPDCIRTVAEAAARAAVPREGSEYKQQVVAGLVRQLLQEIAEEVGGTDG